MYFQKEKDGNSNAEWRTTTNLQRLAAYRYVVALPAVRQAQNALRDMMWVIAAESETWITYQMSYSRSTAVMSMVGYVIGLGDRHLSNEMIDKRTGGVVHIDFGDCFEAAQRR
jgi:FKBP12-rapamycin complex-associated protein